MKGKILCEMGLKKFLEIVEENAIAFSLNQAPIVSIGDNWKGISPPLTRLNAGVDANDRNRT